MSKKIVVAVDGPAGSGKSSVSKEVALKKELKYIDSGALYRSVTWFFLRKFGEIDTSTPFEQHLSEIVIDQQFEHDGNSRTFVGETEVTALIRDEVITQNIGIVSDTLAVRNFVNNFLREWANKESIIMDGRDIGTIVLPDADIKIYIDASVDVRTERRVNEYREMGKNVDENSIKNQIILRDQQDKSRSVGSLKQADDALYLDTSDMKKTEVIEKIEQIITGWPDMDQSVQDATDTMETIDMQFVVDSTLDDIKPGKIITGEIVTIDRDYAYVNVGTKVDGRIAIDEFDPAPQVGETVKVILQTKRFVDGMYQFSKKAAESIVTWNTFKEKYNQENMKISGNIVQSANMGKIIHCEGINAFLPFSLAADLRMQGPSDAQYEFYIKTIDDKKRSIVISRKEFLDEEIKFRWEKFLEKYNTGDTIEGEVIKFVEFGVFVRVEGLDALLHRNDMSWKKIFKQRKILKLEEVRDFKILNINKEERKISLGLKQMNEDPWENIESKYQADSVVTGEVATITAYGVFVELEDGVEGFVNNSELSWTNSNVSAKNIFEKGQQDQFKILSINNVERKLVLGYKQLKENPWDTIKDRFPVGTILKKKIKKVVKFGLFVELENDIDGLIHISDVSWSDDKDKDPLKEYKAGDEVEFKVIEIKKNEMKISCGIKQLQKSPWEMISENYPPRKEVEGIISGITAFGIFVKLQDDVEGLVHISEISRNRIENVEEHFNIGDKVHAVVLGVDIKKKRLSLSVKSYELTSEKEELERIMKDSKPNTFTLGDMINIKLGDK